MPPASAPAADRATRRRLGAVYTPPAEVALACERALDAWLAGRPRAALATASVCDPACGAGAFLAGYRACAGVEPAVLVGVDADPAALRAAATVAPRAALHAGDALATDGSPFAWGRDAPARYDLVLGNPPYVRHQDLRDPLGRPGPYGARVHAAVARLAPGLVLSRRADLSAAFLALGVALLAPGGVLAMVTGSAWLDAAYGEPLARFLLEAGLVEVVERTDARTFADADVNSLIVIVRRDARGDVALRQVGAAPRVRRVPRAALQRERKWGGRLLRARPALAAVRAALERRGGGRLGELAAVGSYLVTGADRFFYLDRAAAEALGLDPAALRDVVKSTRGEERILLAGRTPRVLVSVTEPDRFAGTPTGEYLARGVADGVPTRSGVLARRPWCAIRQEPAPVLAVRTMRDRHIAYLNPDGHASGELYRLTPPPGLSPAALAALLCSSVAGVQLEALGRAYGGGGGPLKVERADLVELVLPPLDALREAAPDLQGVLAPLLARPLGSVAAERGRADREALERLCGELAGLAPAAVEALRDDHVATVEARLARARRVLA
jgi:methylase of polypeptide subunit release factors